MSDKSNYLEEATLNAVFRGVTFPVIGTVYFALCSVIPGEDGTGGTEFSGTGYARVAVTCAAGAFKNPSSATQGQTNNTNKIVFPVANADWGTANAVAIYDASVAGNLLYRVAISATPCPALAQPVFHENQLIVSEA